MGRTLQIRVSASTFDPAEVEKRWPRLSALAFSPVTVKIEALPPDLFAAQRRQLTVERSGAPRNRAVAKRLFRLLQQAA